MRSQAMRPRLVSTAGDVPGGVLHEARHLAVLDDVHAERIRGARVAPGHRVVPRGAGAPLQEPAEDREARLRGHLQERGLRGHLRAAEDVHIDAVHAHGVGPARDRLQVMAAVRQDHKSALAEHDVEVQLAREPLVEAQREVVEARALREEVVGAHDRRVAPGVAAAEPAALEDRHVADPVVLRQVVRGRESVAAAAHDERIVGALGLGRAPHRSPAALPRERPAQQG